MTQEKGKFIMILYTAYLLDFLLNFLKTWYKNYTILPAPYNGWICVSEL